MKQGVLWWVCGWTDTLDAQMVFHPGTGHQEKHSQRRGLSLVLAGEQPQRKKAREMDEWFACCCHLTCCGMWLITYLHGQLLEWTKETQPVEIPGKLSWGPNRKCQSRDFTGGKLKYQCWELCFSKNHSCLSTLGETLWQMYMDNNQGPIDTILSNPFAFTISLDALRNFESGVIILILQILEWRLREI